MNQASSPLAPIVIDEKRKSTRRPVFCKAKLSANGNILTAKMLDIGPGGLALMMEDNAPVGQIYAFQAMLPGPGSTTWNLQSQIQVVHTVLTKTGFRVGCRFVSPDAKTRDMLQQFMRT